MREGKKKLFSIYTVFFSFFKLNGTLKTCYYVAPVLFQMHHHIIPE